MSSSTTSLYNAARKKFRKGRGEKISGNPGEKIKGDSEADEKEEGGNGGQGQDGDNGGDGGEEKTARIGPPAGHYPCATRSRPAVWSLSHARPTCKLIRDLDEYLFQGGCRVMLIPNGISGSQHAEKMPLVMMLIISNVME